MSNDCPYESHYQHHYLTMSHFSVPAISKGRFVALVFLCLSLFSTASADTVKDFFIAVKNDRAGAVKEMLAEGFNPNTQEQERGDTPLIMAMRENSMDVMGLLLADKRTDPDIEAFNGDNALMIAAYNGNEKAVRALLDHGAKVNKDGWTPLHYAAANGNEKIVKMLLDRDASVDAVSPNATTPMMMAARGGHIYAVKLIYDAGADPTIKNQRGYTASDFAKENKNSKIVEGLRFLIDREAELAKRRNVMPQFPF